jgi:cell division protein FtsB
MDTQKYNQIVDNVVSWFYKIHIHGKELIEVDLRDLIRYYENKNEALEKEVEKLEDKIDELEDEINDLEDDFEEFGDFKTLQKKRMKGWLKWNTYT